MSGPWRAVHFGAQCELLAQLGLAKQSRGTSRSQISNQVPAHRLLDAAQDNRTLLGATRAAALMTCQRDSPVLFLNGSMLRTFVNKKFPKTPKKVLESNMQECVEIRRTPTDTPPSEQQLGLHTQGGRKIKQSKCRNVHGL